MKYVMDMEWNGSFFLKAEKGTYNSVLSVASGQLEKRPDLPGALLPAPLNVEARPRGASHKCGSHQQPILRAACPFHEKPHVGLSLSPSSAVRMGQTQGTFLFVPSWILEEVDGDTSSPFLCVLSNDASPGFTLGKQSVLGKHRSYHLQRN